MKRHGLAGSVLLLAACPAAAAAAAVTWPANSVDPHPAPGDLVLPLPCGGAMVFRPVDVPAGRGPLDDRAIEIGRSDSEEGYSQYQRQAWIASPFPVAGTPETRRFYIGKYDVTRDQLATLADPSCPTPSIAGRLPATRVSWAEAVDFTSAWSSWLLAHARDKLPRRGDSLAYARLPTDDEWSYAARGGTKVSETDFLASTWPMPEGIDHYVMAGPAIAGGTPHAVGSMLPNPLGIYDMLGEVDQMLIEPYRLNRVGRSHGQAGGILARGGNYTFNPDDLQTSLRTEIPPFDPATNGPTRLATLGFRLVLSADALGDMRETQAAQAQFDAISGNAARIADSPRQLLAMAGQATPDPAIRAALSRVDAAMASDERARDDAAAVALGAQLQAATVLAMNIWEQANTIRLLEEETTGPTGLDPTQIAAIRHNLDAHRRTQSGSVEGYLDLLRAMAASPVMPRLNDQSRLQRDGMTERGEINLVVFLGIVDADLRGEVTGKALDRTTAGARIAAIPAAAARATTATSAP